MRFLNLVRCLFVQFQCKSSYFLPKVNSTINENGNKNSCKRLRLSWGFIHLLMLSFGQVTIRLRNGEGWTAPDIASIFATLFYCVFRQYCTDVLISLSANHKYQMQ